MTTEECHASRTRSTCPKCLPGKAARMRCGGRSLTTAKDTPCYVRTHTGAVWGPAGGLWWDMPARSCRGQVSRRYCSSKPLGLLLFVRSWAIIDGNINPRVWDLIPEVQT